MDYDQLVYDLQHAPGIRLLKADHVALIISFLHHQFKREQRISVPLPELAERLAETIELLNEQAPDSYPRPAQSYLTERADELYALLNAVPRQPDLQPVIHEGRILQRLPSYLLERHVPSFHALASAVLY